MSGDEFSHLSLADLRVLLRDTLQYAAPSDTDFVQRLAAEIHQREHAEHAEHADA